MSDSLDPDSIAGFPKLIRSSSLYKRSISDNTDKEYHLQIQEVSPGKFTVNFQYGRRGSKLREGTKTPSPVSTGSAISVYNRLLHEKLNEGYATVSIEELPKVYLVMRDHAMDAGGIDLYMNVRGKMVSMFDYAKLAGTAAEAEIAQIAAYSSARAAREFLVEEMGQTIDRAMLQEGMAKASRLLSQSGLEKMGVFLGYTQNGQVYRGLPPQLTPSSYRPA